jgi:hypothetical protein
MFEPESVSSIQYVLLQRLYHITVVVMMMMMMMGVIVTVV